MSNLYHSFFFVLRCIDFLFFFIIFTIIFYIVFAFNSVFQRCEIGTVKPVLYTYQLWGSVQQQSKSILYVALLQDTGAWPWLLLTRRTCRQGILNRKSYSMSKKIGLEFSENKCLLKLPSIKHKLKRLVQSEGKGPGYYRSTEVNRKGPYTPFSLWELRTSVTKNKCST